MALLWSFSKVVSQIDFDFFLKDTDANVNAGLSQFLNSFTIVPRVWVYNPHINCLNTDIY